MWGDHYEESFQESKKRLMITLVLVLPSASESFVVFCDFSKRGLGGMLMQKK